MINIFVDFYVIISSIRNPSMAKQSLYNFLGSYNKAYKSKNVNEKDFSSFLKDLRDFFVELETIDKTNEEMLKNIFNKHLLKIYNTLLNENRVDLSIKKDNKTQVIFEFKSPNNKSEMLQADNEDINNEESFELIKHINNFEKTIVSASQDFEPCYISRYLLSLCGLFNKFYNNHRIIDNEIVSENRLKIVALTKEVIARGLNLLGIDAPNAM